MLSYLNMAVLNANNVENKRTEITTVVFPPSLYEYICQA